MLGPQQMNPSGRKLGHQGYILVLVSFYYNEKAPCPKLTWTRRGLLQNTAEEKSRQELKKGTWRQEAKQGMEEEHCLLNLSFRFSQFVFI